MLRPTACALFAVVLCVFAAGKPTLKVRDDGSFRIAQFCDMHYGEWGAKDEKSGRFQKTILSLENPDLVIFDGDASSNYAAPILCRSGLPSTRKRCKDWFLCRWADFTSPCEESGTPYAYALGNHDRIPGGGGHFPPGNETWYAVPDHWIMQQDETNLFSASRDGPKQIHGASNFVLPILGADGRPAFYVWVMDSSDTNCMGKSGWGCVYPDQVEWYKETSKRIIEKYGAVPGIMFHHIPLDEVITAWNDPDVEIVGTRGEEVCCSSVNTGLFAAIKEMGNIWGVFHGHDHNNDFVATYEGVRIGFGRKSGYGGYSGAVAERRGSRIIEVRIGADGPPRFDTWIREEVGLKIVQKPALNRTAVKDCCGVSASNIDTAVFDDQETCRRYDDADACRRATSVMADDLDPHVLYA